MAKISEISYGRSNNHCQYQSLSIIHLHSTFFSDGMKNIDVVDQSPELATASSNTEPKGCVFQTTDVIELLCTIKPQTKLYNIS